ncbi:MAG: hypothetical protein IJQ34_07355, partial [Kiritimatiellae bacterium]|nr:hypothetical protein [Kiritimatiellia bacterium]
MKKLLLLMIIAPLALAAVPLKWNVETSRINEMRFDAYHGETLDFEAAFNTLGKPLDLSSSSATLYYQTNGMDQAWWSAPGTISGNVARATFTPAMDPGEKQIYAFLAISGSESNQNYRAAARIFFKNSPGAFPNQIEPPAVRLDFNALEIANPPWPAEISAATNEVLQSALRADASLSNNLARAIADATPADYSEVSSLARSALQEETDPTISAWAKASTKPTYTLNEIAPDSENWLGVQGNAGRHIKILTGISDGNIVGGLRVTASTQNDNNMTTYTYNGVAVKRMGSNTDYLWDT